MRAKNRSLKRSAKKVRRTILNLIPVRDYKKGCFYCADGSVFTIFQIQGKNFFNATEEDLVMMIGHLTEFYRQFRDDFKKVSLNYPSDMSEQKNFLLSKINDPKYSFFIVELQEEYDKLVFIERHRPTIENYLFVFAENSDAMERNLQVLDTYFPLKLIILSKSKKLKIMFKLGNLHVKMNR